MENETLTRRVKVKMRQRQEMLAAACHLFCEKGYHNVTMHEIAAEAEFSIGTLYKFFENKEDLYKSLILQEGRHFEEAVTRAMEEPEDEVEKLRNYIRVKGEKLRENLPLIRVFQVERRGANFHDLEEALRERHKAILERLAAIFEAAIQKRRFKKIADPFYLAVALDSVLDALLLLYLEAPEIHPYPKNAQTILDLLFSGLAEPWCQVCDRNNQQEYSGGI